MRYHVNVLFENPSRDAEMAFRMLYTSSWLIFIVFNWLVLIIYTLLQKPLATEHEQQPLTADRHRPNIVFILTDDQDIHMDSLSYMPLLQQHLIDRGTTFTKHYCTVALCCPSRASLWTGKAAREFFHQRTSIVITEAWSNSFLRTDNTNVTDLHPPWGKSIAQLRHQKLYLEVHEPYCRCKSANDYDHTGGYPKFVSQGFNEDYVPVWLQAAGYNTYYVGKFLNAHTVNNYHSPHAAGWTGSDFLLDPFTYRYLNATFQRNFDKPVSYGGFYSTDVVAEKTRGFLDDAITSLEDENKPFFLTVAPIAPHSDVIIRREIINGKVTAKGATQAPPIPAHRHKHLFEDVVVPRTPNFNPDTPGGASWIARLPQQDQENIDYNDDWYRNRLRTLQAVDEMIESLIERLSDAGILDHTYIFYSTDNGYSIGQHRRQPGKQCAFEEDINVPFIVRGPGIPEGITTDLVTSHTDLAPTFLALAGAAPPTKFELDGQPMPLSRLETPGTELNSPFPPWPQEHVNVEMWGIIMSEGKYGMVLYPNHTYKALRVVGPTYNLLYTIWCNNEHELYDMTVSNMFVDDT